MTRYKIYVKRFFFSRYRLLDITAGKMSLARICQEYAKDYKSFKIVEIKERKKTR